ncbi:MAG: hypothetical protein II240_01345, partial [Bacteroidaceae bacterium]|nr:hypothetical protein [Bacteroidaceae bacterium]
GDFMGNLPASEVEQCLVGVRYDRTAIHDRLFPLDIGMYFDHLSTDDFIRLVC